jgi:hypothetical protein
VARAPVALVQPCGKPVFDAVRVESMVCVQGWQEGRRGEESNLNGNIGIRIVCQLFCFSSFFENYRRRFGYWLNGDIEYVSH